MFTNLFFAVLAIAFSGLAAAIAGCAYDKFKRRAIYSTTLRRYYAVGVYLMLSIELAFMTGAVFAKFVQRILSVY